MTQDKLIHETFGPSCPVAIVPAQEQGDRMIAMAHVQIGGEILTPQDSLSLLAFLTRHQALLEQHVQENEAMRALLQRQENKVYITVYFFSADENVNELDSVFLPMQLVAEYGVERAFQLYTGLARSRFKTCDEERWTESS